MNPNYAMRTSHNRDRSLDRWTARVLALQLINRNNRVAINLQNFI